MTREELIEVMARAILRDHEDGANMDTHAVPERAASRHAIAALAALEAAGVRLVYPSEAQAQLIDGDERTTVRIFTPYAPPGVGGE
jgi:hypothetical protein